MTDKYIPGQGTTGSNTSTYVEDIIYPKNWSSASVAVVDSAGKTITAKTVNSSNKLATLSTVLTAADIGMKVFSGKFLGDSIFAAGSSDKSTLKVLARDSTTHNKSNAGTVNQIVAGPGIYISAPNGQGVVTISTVPIDLDVTKEYLHDVAWSIMEPEIPGGVPGAFIAVGDKGTSLRSRDGYNWVRLPRINCDAPDILDVSSELNADIPDQHVEYNGVGLAGKSIYGRAGYIGTGTDTSKIDGMVTVTQLQDQNGAITDDLQFTSIFYSIHSWICNIDTTIHSSMAIT
jgi:hypothetical protein